MTQNRSGRFYIFAPTYKIAFFYAESNGLDTRKMIYIHHRDKLMGLRDIELIYVQGDENGLFNEDARIKTVDEIYLMVSKGTITVKYVWLDQRKGLRKFFREQQDGVDTKPD